MAVVVLMLSGCATAAPSGGQIGAACDASESYWCDAVPAAPGDYDGICVQSVCRQRCVGSLTCADGLIEVRLEDALAQCVCMPPGSYMPPGSPVTTFGAPVGAACDPGTAHYCAGGDGLCVGAVCRAQCATATSGCSAGGVAVVEDLGLGRDECFCSPD